MRIVDIRETSVPLNSSLANSSIDFSEMTTSVAAVITDVKRDGETMCGFAFNSTGRYACGAQGPVHPAHPQCRAGFAS
jgi:D(-)-tartrate dehydratase